MRHTVILICNGSARNGNSVVRAQYDHTDGHKATIWEHTSTPACDPLPSLFFLAFVSPLRVGSGAGVALPSLCARCTRRPRRGKEVAEGKKKSVVSFPSLRLPLPPPPSFLRLPTIMHMYLVFFLLSLVRVWICTCACSCALFSLARSERP